MIAGMAVDPSTHQRTVIDFDQHTQEYRDNWQAISDANTASCPVAFSNNHGGFWLVSDYASLSRVIRDDATFTSTHNTEDPTDPRQGVAIPTTPILQAPLEYDPPMYNAYRRMLNPYFSPTATRAFEPFIRQLTDSLLDRVSASGRIDLVLDLGNPVPAIATMKLLGLPLDDWEAYAEPIHTMSSIPPTDPDYGRCIAAIQHMTGVMAGMLPRVREEPTDGLLSGLANATVNGAPLPDGEVVLIAMLVTQGGVDTTTALLSNALSWLDEHRDQRQRLIDEPALMEHATEEFLRVFAPVQGLARTVTEDVEVAGQKMRAGERVLLSFASANRDPKVFTNPGEILLDRFPNPHTSFGLGIHRCIGSHFARSWFRTMLQAVLTRMPDYAIDREATHRNHAIGYINGFVNMPATFTPSEPLGVQFPS